MKLRKHPKISKSDHSSILVLYLFLFFFLPLLAFCPDSDMTPLTALVLFAKCIL
jgi:hypothetical protein